MEQLNIEGKRSGEGFVAHKAILVSALSRALAERVMLMDLTIGRKGFLGYLKALGGSNIVKVIPSNGSASGSQTIGHKRLKVVCGGNTSYLDDEDWVREPTTTKTGVKGGTPLTFCEVRVSPTNAVKPNIGASELAEALNRVLPFTAKDKNRPVLQCVNFVAKEGKLYLASADGFRLAVVTLPYADGEGQALINRDDLKGIPNALKRAKRVRVGFEAGGETIDAISLVIETDLIRYKWVSVNGNYPDYPKLIPTEFSTVAHFDTVEATKAINSLKVLANSKGYPIDIIIDSFMAMSSPDDKGQAEIRADVEGKPVKIRIDGGYLAQALKACGGMVDLKLTNAYSPTLFTSNGYQLVVMPMMTDEAKRQAKADTEAKAKQAEAEAVTPTPTEPVAEAEPTEPVAEPEAEHKPRHKRKRELVAVA